MKMKTKMWLFYLKAKTFWDKYKKDIKAGAVFWIGIGLVLVAIFSLHGKKKESLRYSADEVTISTGMQIIKRDFTQKQPFTLVLYSPACHACKSAQKRLMKAYWASKAKSRTDHLIMNVKKIKGKKRAELIELIPQIVVYSNKFAIPTVVNVVPISKNKAKIAGLSQDNNPKYFEPVLQRSTKLPGRRFLLF